MDVKEFVKTTLKDLYESVNESNTELGQGISLTNTVLRSKGAGNYGLIDFDLAVEVKNIESSGKGAAVRVSVVEAQVGKEKELSSNSVSRIRFTVEANFR